jgi:hypothetical protein
MGALASLSKNGSACAFIGPPPLPVKEGGKADFKGFASTAKASVKERHGPIGSVTRHPDQPPPSLSLA